MTENLHLIKKDNQNKVIALLSYQNKECYESLINKLEEENHKVLFINEENIESLSTYEEIILVSFLNNKTCYDKIVTLYKDKISKRVFVAPIATIPFLDVDTLILWSDRDKKYHNDRIAYKTFKKYKDNNKYKFICYPLYTHNIHLGKKEDQQLDKEFFEDLLLFINENRVKEKIAIVSENHLPFLNGVNILSDLLKKEFEKMGLKVYIITIKLNNFSYVDWDENNIKLMSGFCLPGKTAKTQALYMTINFNGNLKKIRAMQLDYIHQQNEYSLSKITLKLSKKDKIPYFYTYHTLWDILFDSKFKGLSPIVKTFSHLFLFKPISKYAHVMTVPTNKVIDVWKQKGKTNNIVALPSAIDIKKFSLDDADFVEIEKLKEKYNVKNDFVLGFVGRISFEKNIGEIINYLSTIKNEFPNVKFMIVGNGEALDYLIKLAKKRNVSDKVIFVGEIDNDKVKHYYGLFDAFTTASTFETQGLTYLEALSAKCPLLVRDDRCLDGFIENGVSGFRYKNFQEFVQYLSTLMNDENKKNNIIESSQKQLLNYRKDVWAKKVYKLYLEAKKVCNSNRKYTPNLDEVVNN